MKLDRNNSVKLLAGWTGVASILALTMSLAAAFAIADYEDCPQVTPKIIDCPGETPVQCDTYNFLTAKCTPATFKRVLPGKFTSKKATSETNVQSTTDNDDKVTCTQTGLCVANFFKPGECTSIGVLTVNHEANPLEEVGCKK